MSVKKFKFVSPGVFINEIDNSQRPNEPTGRGPLIIGRTERGPAMVPYQVNSFAEFVTVFGNPISGKTNTDSWRDGNYGAPTYAAYAAQAWLTNNSPVTIVRLLGDENSKGTGTGAAGAGWNTTNEIKAAGASDVIAGGGAYGLWLIDSGSDAGGSAGGSSPWMFAASATGTLGAIFYTNTGCPQLSGSTAGYDVAPAGGIPDVTGSSIWVKSTNDKTFKLVMMDGSADAGAAATETVTFNFDRNSSKYIRKVLNTNPVLTNTAVTTNTKHFWLGETFEREVYNKCTGSAQWGVILPMAQFGTATNQWQEHNYGMRRAKTGWFISQDIRTTSGSGDISDNVLSPVYSPESMQKLFRVHSLGWGEWSQNNLKVSIENVTAPTNNSDPYGHFSVRIRKIEDNDGALKTVELYDNCNLNPNSENYVAKKIGDKYIEWDEDTKRYIEYGSYDNNSQFIRVEMNLDVDDGTTDASYLPFGVYGHPKFASWRFISGTLGPHVVSGSATSGSTSYVNTYVSSFVGGVTSFIPGGQYDPIADGQRTWISVAPSASVNAARAGAHAPFDFPAIPLRSGSLDGNIQSPRQAYFGADVLRKEGGIFYLDFEKSTRDILRALPDSHKDSDTVANELEWSWVFSLDDLSSSSGLTVNYDSGSRAAGRSITAGSGSWQDILSAGFNKFTTVFYGGFDGLRIDESDPFRNTFTADGTELTNYAYNSVKRAIDSAKDPEVVDYNLAVAPGITTSGLTDHLINICEDRGDALAVVDLAGGYVPSSENTTAQSGRLGSVKATIDSLNNRGINSSYGCAYYPWVQIRDTLNNATVWVPPSIAALGAMSNSERKQDLWFAPAGFNRGGLSKGDAGIPVVGVSERLAAEDRDKLYDANINPIASFPNEGIVIFGQKTLQVTPSALDRVNVRRLMIFVKKSISQMANQVLFDQNTVTTWNRFTGKVNPFLASIKARFGLDDFKVVLDNTTTTPDLVDRNIIYAKIFLKPTKAVEYIAIDFTITNSGASFED